MTDTARPTAVTIGVWLMYAQVAVAVVGAVVARVVHPDDGQFSLWLIIIGNVVGLAWLAFLTWGTWRMGRGSDRARFWLTLWAALGVLSLFGMVVSHDATVPGVSQIVLAVAAMVFVRLPSARPFFPHTPRGVRRPAEPRTIGWDPDTGERITEPDDAHR
jgi:hypothetical protein